MSNRVRLNRLVGLATFKPALLSIAAALWVSGGCGGIWNAGDLALWVRDRAVEEGCRRDTIELEEWYTETSGGNVWRGTCRDDQGNEKSFEINVDRVWTPSKSTN